MSGIIVDQWRIVAEVTQTAYCEPQVTPYSKLFDLDTYKILQSFLTDKPQHLKVQALTSALS